MIDLLILICAAVALIEYRHDRRGLLHTAQLREDSTQRVIDLNIRCDRLIGEAAEMRHRWEHAKQENLRLIDEMVKCRRENARTFVESRRGIRG